MGTLFEDVSLEPVCVTVIDLGGRTTAAKWTPWGCSYSSRVKDWTPEKGAAMKALSEATEKRLKKATETQLLEFIRSLSPDFVSTRGRNEKRGLVTMAMILVNEKRAPREFVNEKVGIL